MSGWVKMHRKIEASIIYSDPELFMVFCHLVLNANHKNGKVWGQEVKRGQLLTGRKALAKALPISESKIYRCLNVLEREKIIVKKSNSVRTEITICNYDSYQSEENKSEQQVNSVRTASEHKQECKKERMKEKRIKTYLPDSLEYKLSKYLQEKIREHDDIIEITDKAIQGWCKDFDLMMRVDKREYDFIVRLINAVYNDNFWYKNIKSAGKLRLRLKEGKLTHLINGNSNNSTGYLKPKKLTGRDAVIKTLQNIEEAERMESNSDTFSF